MSTSIPHVPRRMLAGLLAGVLVLAGLAAFASPASAADAIRVFGETRVQTSIEIAERAYPTGTDTVLLATSAVAADSLPGNGLAGALDAALLLTEPDELNPDVETALAALDPTTVILLGETAALSQGVEDAVGDLGYTTERIGGANRYETSALIAAEIDALADAGGEPIAGGFGGDTTVIVTRGDLPFDAVAASPLSFYGPHPVFLTAPGDLPATVADGIEAVGADKAVILGGPAAVSAEVETEIGNLTGVAPLRIHGENRNDTAAELATALLDAGFDASTTYIATGHNDRPYDSLTGGQLAGQAGDPSPILLTRGDTLSDETTAFLAANAADIDQLVVFGGEVAVPASVVDEAIAASGGAPETHEVTLSWINEFREATQTFRNGEVGATGTATVTLNPAQDTVDFTVDYGAVTGPFEAAPGFHIHEGGLTEEGPVVVTLATGAELQADADQMLTGTVDTTANADLGAIIDEILAAPEGYYLNLHSEAFPAGAIRGQLPDGGQDEIPAADMGTLVAVDGVLDLYRFEVEGAMEARTVTYTAADQFTVDGVTATIDEFEAAATIGDMIAFTAGAPDGQVHALVNATVTEGMVGNVNTGADVFDIISPNTGLRLNDGVVYGAGQFTVDGVTATIDEFEADINEGDSITFDQPETGLVTYALTNATVSGEVSDLVTTPATSAAFEINDVLGDEYDAPQNVQYVASAADETALTQVYTIDGEVATYAAFEAAITADDGATEDVNEADTIAYSRTGGVETFALTEAEAPADTTGPTLTAGGTADAPTFAADEELDAATVEDTDVTTNSTTATVTSVDLGTDGQTITVTLSAPLVAGETVTLAADSVADVAGNAGPDAEVVFTAPVP